MSIQQPHSLDPYIEAALEELKRLIIAHYPKATFEVAEGQDDPEQVHLITTVDVDDLDELLDLVIDRTLELQVDQGLPIHVIPVRPLERVIEQLRASGRLPRPRTDCADLTPPTQP